VDAGAITVGSAATEVFGVSLLSDGTVKGSSLLAGLTSECGAAGTSIVVDSVVFEGELPATGCPQFVQKPVLDSSSDPQFVQKAVGGFVAGGASVDRGLAAIAEATGASSSTDSARASSRFPHSVQKTDPGSACAPQVEQTGRVTVTAAAGCAAAGIGLPQDVQKLADSST
jgi:hypothetical protein